MAITPEADSERVSLQLRMAIPEDCPLAGIEGEIVSASRQMIEEGCHSIFVVRPEDGHLESVDWRHKSDRRGERCICHAFCDEGVIPIFDRVDDDQVEISAFLEEETKARSLYESVTEIVRDVEVTRLNTSGDPSHINSLTKVDLSELTTKQREALEVAMSGGYYEEPKETTIEELAAELDISRQAYSHRLKEAERRVFSQVLADS
jgi:predicted DNA binding protein